MQLLVKLYDIKKGLGVYCLAIYPLARHLVPNPQKKKKKKDRRDSIYLCSRNKLVLFNIVWA